MDHERDLSRFLPLKPVQFHVLLSLAAGERHGYGIILDAEGRGDTVDIGTLYRTLARMVDEELIVAVAPPDDASDERRHYYGITARGLGVARLEARRLEALTQYARIGGLLEVAS